MDARHELARCGDRPHDVLPVPHGTYLTLEVFVLPGYAFMVQRPYSARPILAQGFHDVFKLRSCDGALARMRGWSTCFSTTYQDNVVLGKEGVKPKIKQIHDGACIGVTLHLLPQVRSV